MEINSGLVTSAILHHVVHLSYCLLHLINPLDVSNDNDLTNLPSPNLPSPLSRTSPKLTIVNGRNNLGLVSDIMDNGLICLWSGMFWSWISRDSLPQIMSDTSTKYSPSLVQNWGKSFVKEVGKLAPLSSYTIWNASQDPTWGLKKIGPSLL